MKKQDLTQGNVWKTIVALAIPIMGSSLLQFTYSIIDMFWVGGLGSDAVASIGSSSFYVGLGYSINALVVIGTGIKVAHLLGRDDNEKARKFINSGLVINTVMALVYGAFLLLCGRALIGFLDLNNAYVEENSYIYLAINAPIMFFTFFNTLYARIFNSYGINKSTLKINATGIIINIILDPILIYTFDLGIFGAALATLVSAVTMFILFRTKSKGVLKYDSKIGTDKEAVIEIIKLGFPMATQRILFTVVNIILAKIIAMFGTDAIAGQKVALQIESIMFMVIGGLNGAVASFIGQNYGAKKFDRIREGYGAAIKVGIIYSFLSALVFMFMPEVLVRIFIQETETVAIAVSYLQIVAFSQIFSSIEMVSNGMFTGLGAPRVPATISIIFTILRIPLALFFIRNGNVTGVWISIALSSVLKGITSYAVYKIKFREEYLDVR